MSSNAIGNEITAATLPQAFFAAARQYDQNTALVAAGGTGASYTYAAVYELVLRLASGLQKAGLVEPREVGLLSENRPEWCIAYLAILTAGGTVVPIDAHLKETEIGYIAGHARLRVVLTSGRFERTLEALPGNLRVVSFEEASPYCWADVMSDAGTLEPEPGNETAVLIYTSGTTGAPKAVELTHRNLLANLNSIRATLHFDRNDTFLSVLPLHHTFESTCGFLTPLMVGARVAYARSFKSREIREDIRRSGATVMCGVPLLFEKMYHTTTKRLAEAPMGKRLLFHLLYLLSRVGWVFRLKVGKRLFRPLREKAGLGSVRMFVSGAAAMAPHVARFFNLIGFDFLQGYGLTEASPVVAVNRPGNIKPGSVGPPLVGVEVAIDNPDAKGIGEIKVRGDNVTPGYRAHPEATSELLRDGWMYTGDMGYLRGGHLWITGRKKSLIVSGAGKNIYPEELEEKLGESTIIAESVVFGRKRPGKQGEEVWALIVPDVDLMGPEFAVAPGQPDPEKIRSAVADVIQSVNSRVAAYKRISQFEIQFEELERTTTKKVKRFVYK